MYTANILNVTLAILGLILFLKIWGMTNNVKRIWERSNNQDFEAKACYTYLKGDIDETERLLNEAFLQEVSFLSKSITTNEDWQKGYRKVVAKYKRAFKKIDKPTPDFEKYKDPKIYLL